MALLRYNNIGNIGELRGIAPYELPREAWTLARNVRALSNRMQTISGHMQIFGTPSVVPYWSLPVISGGTVYWIYTGLAKVYVVNMTTQSHSNITRQTASVDVDYGATSPIGWNGCVLNGIPVLNNSVDPPQMWNPVSTSQRLQALSNWPASTTARVMRSFKNFLVTLDITKSGTNYPTMVKWSHPADPGTVPNSWDPADSTKDAGEQSLSETQGALIDGLSLRDIFVLYKEDSTWGMQFIGHPFIFRFFRIFGESGILSQECVREIKGKHVVVTREDIIIHDGQQASSIFPSQFAKGMASSLFNSIDSNNFNQAHLAVNYRHHEVWFCYPEQGNTYCNRALIWNWDTGALTSRDLPYTSYIAMGPIDPDINESWDADSAGWDTDESTWNQSPYSVFNSRMMLVSPTNTKLYMADETNTFDGTTIQTELERTGIKLTQEGDGAEASSVNTPFALVKELWLKLRSTQAMTVYVGSQVNLEAPVNWGSALSYDANTVVRMPCYAAGRAFSIKFTSSSYWELEGFMMDVQFTATY